MVAGPKLLDAADSATREKINENVALFGLPGRIQNFEARRSRLTSVVLAENLADLLGKAHVTGRLRLVAALLRLQIKAVSDPAFIQETIVGLETPDAFGRAPFAMMDILRRALGNALGAFGLDPDECPYRIVGLGPHWRLRDYGGHDTSLSLLIVAAPIKRAYIWDLAPSVSAVRYCMRGDLHVYLLEWMPASQRNQNNGLDEYTEAISECVAKISGRTSGTAPFLVGHSLGGTLAAIFNAWAPASIRGLILLGAPLCFEPATSRFRDALVSLVPPALSDGDPFPGSLLSFIATLASPGTFIWSRLMDAASSITDRQTLEINARVERWALDEVPLPGKLVHQIIQWLYRENRFCLGTLRISETLVGPSSLSVPALAVVTMADEVAPLASVKPCIDAMPATGVRIIQYPGEIGVGLQHLGILVGRQARAHVWPEIISWIKTHS